MKKIFSKLMFLALAAMTFTACEDVPEPYDIPGTGENVPGGSTVIEGGTGEGTLESPFNAIAAINYGKSLASGEVSADFIYIKGKVSSIKEEFTTQYGNGTFYISEDGTSANQFYVYRVYYLGNKKFASGDTQIKEGDEVIVCGKITNYNGTIETAQNSNSFLYSLNGENRGGEPKPATPGADPTGDGTQANPYNVSALLKYIATLGSDIESPAQVYVKGKVSQVKEEFKADSYGNGTFYISDDGTASNEFYVFRTLYLGNKKFAQGDTQIQVGDEVIICGNVVNFKGNTPETVQNKSYLYSLNGKTEGETPSEVTYVGSAESPKSVADALTVINGLADNGTTAEWYYIKGKIKTIKTTADNIAKYKNIDYVITDDGNNELTVFRGKNLNNTDFTEAGQINVGDEVVVVGTLQKYVNSKNGQVTPEMSEGNYIVKYTKGSGEAPDPQPSGDLGTADSPITVAKAIEIINGYENSGESPTDAYVKGKIVSVQSYNSKYKSITYYISDDGTADNQLQVYSGKGLNGADFASENDLTVGSVVVVKGKLKKFVKNDEVTPEINQSSEIISIDGNAGGGDTPGGDTPGGDTPATSLTNGDFETWADGQPTGWKSASSASSATLSQSTDAHGGSYSVNVNGKEGSNVRLASQEMKLPAGTYVFSFYAKATTADPAQVRPGHVPVADDGKVGSYAYGDYATLSNESWTQVSCEFTLNAETTVCLVVMNPKKSNYSSGKDVLVDDATLTKK